MEQELTLVKSDLHELPKVTSFACSTEGAVATFTRTLGNEEITASLDANSGVEMDLMSEDLEDEADEVSIRCVGLICLIPRPLQQGMYKGGRKGVGHP